jgi:hypothetical protein
MPLPQLRVSREDYCRHEVVDLAVACLETHRPELIENLMLQEHWRQQDYSEAAWAILEYLTEANAAIPITLIGRRDLIAELTRKGRSAAGLAEIAPSGKPLATGPDAPLPPLVDLEICEHTRERNQVTQDMADRVLRIAYDQRPDLWLAVAEEQRHEILLDATDQFRALLKEIVNAEYPGQDNMWPTMYLYDEGILRIHRMCGISEPAAEPQKLQ